MLVTDQSGGTREISDRKVEGDAELLDLEYNHDNNFDGEYCFLNKYIFKCLFIPT